MVDTAFIARTVVLAGIIGDAGSSQSVRLRLQPSGRIAGSAWKGEHPTGSPLFPIASRPEHGNRRPAKFERHAPERLEEITDSSAAVISTRYGNGQIDAPLRANVFTAHRPVD
jgi:hypothetical protein